MEMLLDLRTSFQSSHFALRISFSYTDDSFLFLFNISTYLRLMHANKCMNRDQKKKRKAIKRERVVKDEKFQSNKTLKKVRHKTFQSFVYRMHSLEIFSQSKAENVKGE